MKDIWEVLAERTQAWGALNRQGLADAVWADYVSFRFGRTGDPRALDYLYPYLNGRERGYALQADLDIPVFLFAESRGSDDIVVYEDPKWNVFGTGIPSEESYKNSKHFPWQKEEQAAQYIAKRLKKLIRERDRDKKAKNKAEAKARDSMLKRHAARTKKAAKRKKARA